MLHLFAAIISGTAFADTGFAENANAGAVSNAVAASVGTITTDGIGWHVFLASVGMHCLP